MERETEQRLQLDADILRMALELAEDVAADYATTNEQTKRRYKQGFFTGLFVRPEWDDDQQQTIVMVIPAELTEPYRELLADDSVSAATKEARLIRQRSRQSRKRPYERLSAARCSIFVKLAGMAGKFSKSPWPLIRRLHDERYGPRPG